MGHLELAKVAPVIGGVTEADAGRPLGLVAVGAAEGHRGEVPVQGGGIGTEAGDGRQRHRPGHLVEAS